MTQDEAVCTCGKTNGHSMRCEYVVAAQAAADREALANEPDENRRLCLLCSVHRWHDECQLNPGECA